MIGMFCPIAVMKDLEAQTDVVIMKEIGIQTDDCDDVELYSHRASGPCGPALDDVSCFEKSSTEMETQQELCHRLSGSCEHDSFDVSHRLSGSCDSFAAEELRTDRDMVLADVPAPELAAYQESTGEEPRADRSILLAVVPDQVLAAAEVSAAEDLRADRGIVLADVPDSTSAAEEFRADRGFVLADVPD